MKPGKLDVVIRVNRSALKRSWERQKPNDYVRFSALNAVINMSRRPEYLRKGHKGCGQNCTYGHISQVDLATLYFCTPRDHAV